MRDMLENLWNEYFAEECAVIETVEEKEYAKNAIELHKAADELLTKEQSEAVEKYIDELLKIQNSLIRKAFFKGCKLAVSLLFEA